ncbi:hypothetical protein VTO58DRAFT_109506 [Aureobasidium pullulans]|nr:hypothetical protein JADG_001849 [Aureobasidium pullulans]
MDLFTRQFGGLSHAVVVVLIKIRLLVDLRALHQSVIVHEKLPRELVDNVHDQLVSNIIAANKDTVKSQDLSPEIKKVESQVNELYRYIAKANKHFWPALLDLGRDLTARPPYYSRGHESKMHLCLAYSYDAWRETPDAIDVIGEKTSNKLRQRRSKSGII